MRTPDTSAFLVAAFADRPGNQGRIVDGDEIFIADFTVNQIAGLNLVEAVSLQQFSGCSAGLPGGRTFSDKVQHVPAHLAFFRT